jgi:hypothetical protein
MTQVSDSACASCGVVGSGRFCSACGAPRVAAPCPQCGAALAPGARFCSACGQPATGAPRGVRADPTPWIIAGTALAAVLVAVLVIVARPPAEATVAATAASAGPPGDDGSAPDISGMSARERFDRLYNRVMRAAQTGDEASVARFTPMALMAYGQLDSLDADARYHAAHTGFLEHYGAEMKAARPEYADHRVSVEEFHRQALAARSSRPGT